MNLLKKTILSILVLSVLFFSGTFFFKYRAEKKTENESAIGKDGISSLEKIRIGGMDQSILLRGQSLNNPVLLILHGGPGAGSIGFAREFYKELEKDFVVINWDQRGAGKSFGLSVPGSSMNPDQFVSDTLDVVSYIRKRFHTKKIFLMGHSWGGHIGAIASHKSPENFHAFIAIGPVVNGGESSRISYEYIRDQLLKDGTGNSTRPVVPTFDEYMKNRRYWLNRFGAGMFHGENSMNEDRYLGGLMFSSPEYSLSDIVMYPIGMLFSRIHIWPYFFKMDLFGSAPTIRIPVYFVAGKYDYYNPPEILLKYMNTLNAPQKEIIWFENSAHAPHFEEPSRFAETLRKIKKESFGSNG